LGNTSSVISDCDSAALRTRREGPKSIVLSFLPAALAAGCVSQPDCGDISSVGNRRLLRK